MNNKNKIFEILKEQYKDAKCELNFNSNFELLIAVILSAQCTDKRVNKTTEVLFKKYNTPQQFASINIQELEELIKPCGFYHNKAKNIKNASIDICNKHNGKVPSKRKDLESLSGVGKKTASVVLATAFKIPAIAVDTHVLRLSNRLGFVNDDNPNRVSEKLQKIVPKNFWIDFHYSMVLHGRYVCKSRKPDCENCRLREYCKYIKEK